LDEFLDAAPSSWRWAVELRDASWLDDRVFDVLARHGAALCVHDLIADHPQLLTADWTYVRFHGPDALARPYHGRYGSRGLARRARWLEEVLDGGRDAYAYFNNDWHGHAVVDAQLLSNVIGVPRDARLAATDWCAPRRPRVRPRMTNQEPDPRVSTVPLDTEDGGEVVIEQQNAGPGNQVGGGEFKNDRGRTVDEAAAEQEALKADEFELEAD
jgi:hypothetical protein